MGLANWLYKNLGDGRFERVTEGQIAEDVGSITSSASWADYNNDGFLDLFVSNTGPEGGFLYRNNQDGTFSRAGGDTFANVSAPAQTGVTWGDYDNDGDLDLFVTNGVFFGAAKNLLYENNGDGSFTRILKGGLVNDGGWSWHASWQDYDNDGFLDLYVSNQSGAGSDFLYRNNGRENWWLKVRLVGTASNRDGIGAKLRVKASIGNKETIMLREINIGSYASPSNRIGHFGLGDATVIDELRVEWPSGAVNVFHSLPVNQSLQIVEGVTLGSPQVDGSGQFSFDLTGLAGQSYLVEVSSDLSEWGELEERAVIPAGGENEFKTIRYTDQSGFEGGIRYFRVLELEN